MSANISFSNNYFNRNICNNREWQETFEKNFQEKLSILKQKRRESKLKRDKENVENTEFIDLEANIVSDDGLSSSCCSTESSCDEVGTNLFGLGNVSKIWNWWGSKFSQK